MLNWGCFKMKPKRLSIIIVFCSLMLLFGCSTKQENIEQENGLLLLVNNLPFGIEYQDVKNHFPKLGLLKDEGGSESLGERGLKEASTETILLGHQVRVEFNFENNKLYSCGFSTTHENENIAVELYNYLQDFYTEEYGTFFTEEQEEVGISSVSSYWQTRTFQLALIHQKNWDGKHFVNWG